MNIHLRDITQDNFNECINLSLSEEQKQYLSSNVYSIAESKIFPFWIPKAIYQEEQLVGFLMYAKDYEEGKLDICRLMIDIKKQGKGYGIGTLELMKNIAKEDNGINRIVVHVKKENECAKNIYKKFGFIDMNMIEYGQDVFIFKIIR